VCPEHPEPMITTFRVSLMNVFVCRLDGPIQISMQPAILGRDLDRHDYFCCVADFRILDSAEDFVLESAEIFASSSGTIDFTRNSPR